VHLAEGSHLSAPDLGSGLTLPALWSLRRGATPTVPVLRIEDGGWVSAAELWGRVAATAGALQGQNVRPGDRVLWVGSAQLDSLAVALGILHLGAVLVPVNPSSTEREFAHIVAEVEPTVAFVATPAQSRWVQAAGKGQVRVVTDLLLSSARAEGLDDIACQVKPADPALIVFTSGTTGSPKGAVLSHANLVAGLSSLSLAWDWTSDDRLVSALPLFHVHGLCVALFGTLALGGSIVLHGRFDEDAVLEVASARETTMFFGVPTMYHRLARSKRVSELARLRLCVSGSAALPAAAWHEIRDKAGVEVLERYGTTETLLTISNPLRAERRPGTVGFPLPGVEVRLTEHEGANSARELWVRGPTVFSGYWNRPTESAECFEGDWYRTADLAEIDEDGYLAIRGRRSELIVTGGYNVYPAEVEDVLATHPDIAEVAVSAVPSDEWGEEVVAWVVPVDARPAEAELEAFAAQRLAPYKRPRRYVYVDALPRNAMGKIMRNALS
jgi:malonyl-CoA/methylmalonyl-CoA synthetase